MKKIVEGEPKMWAELRECIVRLCEMHRAMAADREKKNREPEKSGAVSRKKPIF